MKKLVASEKRAICSNPDSLFRYFGWPSVARLQDGTLAMVASGFRLKHICPFGKGILCYSRDEGNTWTAPAVIMDTPLDDRDSGIVPFAGGRRVIFTSFNNTVAAQRNWSQNAKGEHKWADQARKDFAEAYLRLLETTDAEERYLGSTYRISEDGGYTFGPVKRVPVTAPHGPCVLNDGSLFYVGRGFTEDNCSTIERRPDIQCWHMNAQDEFEYVSSIENINDGLGPILSCEPHSIQLPSGKIIVHIRVERYRSERRLFTVFQSESIDGGKTFSKPRQILGDLGGSPAHLLLHSSGVLISTYGYREKPYGERVMLSRDEGETWDTDYVLDADANSGDLGYPATVELNDGRLLTVYYENIGEQSVIMQQTWCLPE